MDAAQEVKNRIDIVDIIQEYLPMKPAGSGSFKGVCPFHKENTPSFFANRPRQSWHCFGCDQGGDAIDFVMRMEGLEFREALELLAQKAGITLPASAPKDTSQKKRLHEINAAASKWFRVQLLKNPGADHARAYADSRGIDTMTGDLWGIGYAPDNWDALVLAMRERGIMDQELVLAGLASPRQSGGGLYSRFRGRLMFAIADHYGNTVGFTGRLLSPDAKEAKYVNTPETPVYKKSEILYGFDKARGEMKRRDAAIVVEGNMDAVSSHRIGIEHVVASSGTALTEQQLRLLGRYTTNLFFAFDADAGGLAAAKRGVELARGMGFSIRMIILPDGSKDPDELIRKDAAAWADAAVNAPEYTQWLYRIAFRTHANSDPQSKKLIAQSLLPEFARIADPVERDGWVVRLADDLGVSSEAIRDGMKNLKPAIGNPKPGQFHQDSKPPASGARLQDTPKLDVFREQLMAILYLKPEFRELAESSVHAYTPASEEIQTRAPFLAILADREFPDQSDEGMQSACEELLRRITEELNRQKRHELERLMKDAERSGDSGRIRELLQEFQKLP